MKFRNILKRLFETSLTVEETDNMNDNFAVYLHVIRFSTRKIKYKPQKEQKKTKGNTKDLITTLATLVNIELIANQNS
jgi:hypothetical protein